MTEPIRCYDCRYILVSQHISRPEAPRARFRDLSQNSTLTICAVLHVSSFKEVGRVGDGVDYVRMRSMFECGAIAGSGQDAGALADGPSTDSR